MKACDTTEVDANDLETVPSRNPVGQNCASFFNPHVIDENYGGLALLLKENVAL